MESVDFVVEGLRVAGTLGSENRHSVIDVIFFFGCDGREGFAQDVGSYFADAEIAGDGEGFEHDFLDDQAGDEVALGDATQECLAEALPMLGVYVIGDVYSNFAAFGGEGGGVSALALGMLERVGYFGGIVANFR